MPTSDPAVITTVLEHMKALKPRSVLDVGPGYGKYGVLFREYCKPTPVVVAVEAWEPYVKKHFLRGIYDKLIVADVRDLTDATINQCHVVYLGDVIEHMPKKDGQQLLDRIKGPVVINTPEHFFSNPKGLPWTEEHVSHWTVKDFERTGRLVRKNVVNRGIVVTLKAP